MARYTGFVFLALAVPLHAAGAAVSPRQASATSSASVSIPPITAIEVRAGSQVSIALFRTGRDVVVVRSIAAARSAAAILPVSFSPALAAEGPVALSLPAAGGWITIHDEIPAAVRRASTRGDAAAIEVTYEIWSF